MAWPRERESEEKNQGLKVSGECRMPASNFSINQLSPSPCLCGYAFATKTLRHKETLRMRNACCILSNLSTIQQINPNSKLQITHTNSLPPFLPFAQTFSYQNRFITRAIDNRGRDHATHAAVHNDIYQVFEIFIDQLWVCIFLHHFPR
jgi:hypothetical protein